MVKLKGKQIYLRALEQKDLNFLYELENNTEVWEVSGTITPFSKDVLQLYLDNAHRDIYDVKQLRLVICTNEHKSVGLIDVFDFDPNHRRAGIGIIVKIIFLFSLELFIGSNLRCFYDFDNLVVTVVDDFNDAGLRW